MTYRVPSTVLSRARTRSTVCWPWFRPDGRRDSEISFMRVSRVVFGDGGEPVPELPEPGFLGKGYHLVPASLVGPAAVGVFAAQDAGLLSTEGAGAGRGFQEAGEGHGVFVWPRVRSLQFVYWNWVTISYLSAQ